MYDLFQCQDDEFVAGGVGVVRLGAVDGMYCTSLWNENVHNHRSQSNIMSKWTVCELNV